MLKNVVFLQDSNYQVVNEVYSRVADATSFSTTKKGEKIGLDVGYDLNYPALEFYSEASAKNIGVLDEESIYISFSEEKYPNKNVCRIGYFDTKNSNTINYGSYFVLSSYEKFVNMWIPQLFYRLNSNPYLQAQQKGVITCGIHNNPNLSILLNTLSVELKTKINFVPIADITDLTNNIGNLDVYVLSSWSVDDFLLYKQCAGAQIPVLNHHTLLTDYSEMIFGKKRNKFDVLFEVEKSKQLFKTPKSLFIQYLMEKHG